jgi:hypothetical protein
MPSSSTEYGLPLGREKTEREQPTRRAPRVAGLVAAGAVATAVSLVTGAVPAGAAGPERAAPTRGEVHFVIWNVDSDGPGFQAILSGAIGDHGTAVTVLPDGRVDPRHSSEMKLDLRRGTFRLRIAGLASEFRARLAHEPVYPATCSDYLTVMGSVPVVAGSGTGAYRGIHGEFSSALTVYEDQKTPHCAPSFTAQMLMLTGSGTVSS